MLAKEKARKKAY
jgi:hypothetical protein